MGRASTQQAFGRFFVDLAHNAPDVAEHVVTVSPDVASSTNLGGWINHVGHLEAGRAHRLVRRRHRHAGALARERHGQHIELGIAEGNLVGLLGELGVTWSRDGQPLLPIGTLYDPFVNRALEPWSFGIYAGGAVDPGRHAVGRHAGTRRAARTSRSSRRRWASSSRAASPGSRPSDRTSSGRCCTRSSLLGQPDGDVVLLPAQHSPDRPGAGRRARRRASARAPAPARLPGGYPLRTASGTPEVTLVGMGAIMPEVLEAAAELAAEGVACDVICLTSPDLVFRALQARQGLGAGDDAILDELFPAARGAPIVSVLDGHPHTLSFLSAINQMTIACLGVTTSASPATSSDLYRAFGIDADTIVGAALGPAGGGRRLDPRSITGTHLRSVPGAR